MTQHTATPFKYLTKDTVLVIDTDKFLQACPADTACRLNGDRTVAVSETVYWNEDMTTCPRGVKVQLLGAGGVASYGNYDGKDPFWIKWQSVPRNRPKAE